MLSIPRSIALAVSTAALALSACNVPVRARAPEAAPNLVPLPSPLKVNLPVVLAPRGEYCAKTPSLRDVCVEGFEQALKNGLWKVLVARTQVVERDGLSAELRMISFNSSHGSAVGPRVASLVNLSMAWQFTLRDSAGRIVLALNETTFGPTPLLNEEQLPSGVKALIESVLERIAGAIGQFAAAPAQPPPPATGPSRGCVSGSTQECFGPGACRGGQACLPDGSGYEPCDCGTGTKM